MDEDILAILAITILIAIPLLAISARIALKPIVEAITKLRGDGANSPHARALQDRRIVELEEQMDRVVDELRSLREVVRFQDSLGPGTSAEERPKLKAAPPESNRR